MQGGVGSAHAQLVHRVCVRRIGQYVHLRLVGLGKLVVEVFKGSFFSCALLGGRGLAREVVQGLDTFRVALGDEHSLPGIKIWHEIDHFLSVVRDGHRGDHHIELARVQRRDDVIELEVNHL